MCKKFQQPQPFIDLVVPSGTPSLIIEESRARLSSDDQSKSDYWNLSFFLLVVHHLSILSARSRQQRSPGWQVKYYLKEERMLVHRFFCKERVHVDGQKVLRFSARLVVLITTAVVPFASSYEIETVQSSVIWITLTVATDHILSRFDLWILPVSDC
jgi:hypothetical protein